MDLNVRLVTRPIPDIWVKTIILIIIVIAVLSNWTASHSAETTVTVTLGAGLLAGHAQPALTAVAELLTGRKADSGSAA